MLCIYKAIFFLCDVCFSLQGTDMLRQKMQILISLSLIGYAFGVFTHENVIFHKINDITTTRARWLVTFVQDLHPFQYYLTKLAADIKGTIDLTKALIKHYHDPKQDSFRLTLNSLLNEVTYLRKTEASIIQSYTDYKSLESRSRLRRSLIPWAGQILSFLFGTVSEVDLENIQRALKNLANNQQSIMHILNDQMSILNVSRTQIAENRLAINTLAASVSLFDERLRLLTEAVAKRFEHLETFVNIYSQMDLMLGQIKDAIQRGSLYLQNLRLELNMLSLNHLSPSTITPKNLRKILIDIRTRLPSSLKLPGDPMTNIWYFYRTLKCKTVLNGDKILVVINIPLLDFSGKFEVFRVHNIPLPITTPNNQTEGFGSPDMIATYEIEYPGILLNKDRSKYALLSENEIQKCSSKALKYCSPQNAILPVNLNRLCMLALFFKDNVKVTKYCHKIVKVNTLLPLATYISQGKWVVSTNKELFFSIVCVESGKQRSSTTTGNQRVVPPIGIIQLAPGCYAANDFLSLPPYYQFEGRVTVPDSFNELLKLHNKTNFRMWAPFHEALPNFTKLDLPADLAAIEPVPMDELILRLQGLRRVKVKETSWPIWAYILMNLIMSMIVGGFLFWYLRYYKKGKCHCIFFKCCKRLAILSGNEKEANGDEPKGLSGLVSYDKKDETVSFHGSNDAATPEQRTNQYVNDSIIRHIYPSLQASK